MTNILNTMPATAAQISTKNQFGCVNICKPIICNMRNSLKTKNALLLLLGFLVPLVAQSQINPCRYPTDLAVSDITANSAQLSWTENGNATEWHIMLNEDNAHLVYANTNPFVLTGLTPGTNYAVKVNPVCEVDKWSDAINFTTIPFEGSGTETDPYIIATTDDMAALATLVIGGNQYSGTHFLMTADLDYSEKDYTPIGNTINPFSGFFDGNGHTISNVTLSSESGSTGVFAWVRGGIVENLTLDQSSIGYRGYGLGGIAGDVEDATIRNCINKASITANDFQYEGHDIGGIVGYAGNSNIIDCQNYGDVDGCYRVGGIVGSTGGNTLVSGCQNHGDVNYSGGYLSEYIGGIVGDAENSTISHCKNTGIVFGYYTGGGIVGYAAGCTVNHCLNLGNVDVAHERVGGIVGRARISSVSNCLHLGKIEGYGRIGGIVGRNDGTENTYANNYHRESFYAGIEGTNVEGQAMYGYAVSGEDGITVGLAGSIGLAYEDIVYAGNGQDVELALGDMAYMANAGTLTLNGDTWILTMPAEDVVISIDPCPMPINIAVGILTHQTADITWDGKAESCTLRYREAVETNWTTPEDATAITGHVYRIIGLETSTTYEMQMKSNCDDSEWSETLTFTTMAEGKYFIGEGDWCEAGSWVPAGVPTLGDDVTLRANATVLTGCVAEANSINLDGNTLTIEDGGQLKSNNNVNATIKKHITSYGESTDGGWYLVGFPTDVFPGPAPIDLGLITTESDYDLYYFAYNVPDGLEWRNYKAGSIIRIQALLRYGYLYANAADMDIVMSNNLNGSANDDIIRLFYDGDYVFKGWELHGNPFPCDAYVLDNATGEYRNFYRMNAAGDGFIAATGVVHPMEGFFTQATATEEKIRISRNAPAVQGNMLSVNLMEANSTHRNAAPTDRAILRFGEGNALEKFSFREGTSKVYIPQGGKDYAIVCADGQNEMPLNFKAAKNGTYTLDFDMENVEFDYLHLIDNMTGADVDLLASPTYTFTAKTTDYASRFRLVFNAEDASTGSASDAPFAYISNGNIVITADAGDATLQVVDVLGRVVRTVGLSQCGSRTTTTGMPAGMYVLRLIDGDSVRMQKIVVP